MSSHAKLSPSSSAKWLHCSGALQAEIGIVDKPNSMATEGTALHALSEMILLEQVQYASDMLGKVVETITITKSMVDEVEAYVDYCRSMFDKNSIVMVEERFKMPFIDDNTFGTSDLTILNGTHLHVIDAKFGRGLVKAEENTQLMLYALGAIYELEAIYDIEKVTLHIGQPKLNHFDSWETSKDNLLEWSKWVKERADATKETNPVRTAGQQQCKWCKAQDTCVALREHVESAITGAFDNIEDIEGQADKVDITHIKNILDNAELITSFVKAIQDVALEKMQSGTEIEGYKMIRTRKNKAWSDKDKAEKYLIRKLKMIGAYKRTLITPTQAIAALGKDHSQYLEKWFTIPEGNLKVVPLSSKGNSVTSAIDCFDKL